MPETLTGLLLFVVLLMPGFAYLVGKERSGTERRLSSFREPAAIIAASVASELVVLVLFACIRTIWPPITPDVGALIRNPGDYLRGTSGHPGHYANTAIWAIGLLAVAVALAFSATVPRVRRVTERVMGPYPHDSTVSAWWILFERWGGKRTIELVCMLDDGSSVRGQFGSFNTSADDSPDRDLILKEPLYYRPPGARAKEVPYPAKAVCCPASRIVSMFVNYFEPDQQSLTALLEAGARSQPTVPPSGASQSGEAPTEEPMTASTQLPDAAP